MTTLVGIKTGNGDGGVILGSDIARTQTSWNPRGDVAYRSQRRTEGQKIYIADNQDLALCMSGVFDHHYVGFLSRILDGNIDFRKALETGIFNELRDLNLNRTEGRYMEPEGINSLLVATRFEGQPKLYTCWPLGRVDERGWTAIGSGSDYALQHIGESGNLIPRRINIEQGVDLVVQALDKAAQDLYTGGLDLVAVTKDKIFDLGKDIRKKTNDARLSAVEEAKEKLR